MPPGKSQRLWSGTKDPDKYPDQFAPKAFAVVKEYADPVTTEEGHALP